MAEITAKSTSDAVPAKAVCKETEKVADAANGSSFQEEAKDPDAAASVQRHGCTSQPAERGVQQSPANDEVPCEQKQGQSSQTTCGGRANAEGVIVHSTSDSSNMARCPKGSVRDLQHGHKLDSSTTATGTVLQERMGSVHGNAAPASTDAGKGSQLPQKSNCTVDRGLNTVDIKSSKQTGDMLPALRLNKQASSLWMGAKDAFIKVSRLMQQTAPCCLWSGQRS